MVKWMARKLLKGELDKLKADRAQLRTSNVDLRRENLHQKVQIRSLEDRLQRATLATPYTFR